MNLFNGWTFVFTIINILVLYYILKKLLFKPVTQFLQERQDKIKTSLEEADREKKEAYELKAKYEEILQKADNEGKAIIDKAEKMAEIKANQIIEDAHKVAEEMIENARKEIELETVKAMHDLRTEISHLIVDAASRVIEKKFPIEDENIINEVIEEAGGSWYK
ncbi:MAG TPA: F0F1 ATP synthase subunit B [Clostridia bacterium]|nr:F0F1 ATP synthase subunit B [Clostridia bacterium]